MIHGVKFDDDTFRTITHTELIPSSQVIIGSRFPVTGDNRVVIDFESSYRFRFQV